MMKSVTVTGIGKGDWACDLRFLLSDGSTIYAPINNGCSLTDMARKFKEIANALEYYGNEDESKYGVR